jgi:2-polyprenyl-3-methyl-5-hydroxy-6-metoxy-1,4-benzoquinol methylase
MKITEVTGISVDPDCGFGRLNPLPSEDELADFYKNAYYELVFEGKSAPDQRRIENGGPDGQRESKWLTNTLWNDIRDIAESLLTESGPRLLLDVGCGMGHFASYMKKSGWNVYGVEIAHQAETVLQSAGIISFRSLATVPTDLQEAFSLVTLLNVLEHVLSPEQLLMDIRRIISPTGVVAIRVPNDFSRIQDAARTKLNKAPWWIAAPAHVNYFDFNSLVRFLKKYGYEILYMFTDFPMEFFLLMGLDYVDNQEVGAICHSHRVSFEMSTPTDLRRSLYKCFAANGLGRNCLAFARPV